MLLVCLCLVWLLLGCFASCLVGGCLFLIMMIGWMVVWLIVFVFVCGLLCVCWFDVVWLVLIELTDGLFGLDVCVLFG